MSGLIPMEVCRAEPLEFDLLRALVMQRAALVAVDILVSRVGVALAVLVVGDEGGHTLLVQVLQARLAVIPRISAAQPRRGINHRGQQRVL